MRYPLDVLINIHASVSIYRNDGTVVITHGGVEMGQGINTKVTIVVKELLIYYPLYSSWWLRG